MEAVKTAPTALAKRDEPTGFELMNLGEAEQFAAKIARSGLMPADLRNKPEDVLVVLVTGHELGLRPMQAIRSVHVIQGKPVLSAELKVSLCLRSPECEYFRLVSSTDKSATYETKRRGHPEPVSMTFTMEQAHTAGLAGKATWKAHPAAMLRARCSSALASAVYQDLVGGMYTPDEAEEIREPAAPARAPATHYQVPAPAAARREEAVDAELVTEPAHDAMTGELPGDAGDPGAPPQLSEEEEIAGWRQMIAKADSPAALADIGASLGAQYPKGHKIRKAINDDYAARQKELRR
jgi:hypothetical protein